MRQMLKPLDSIVQTVGRTPVVKLNRCAAPGVNLFAKLEAFNPMGSVKDRLAQGVIEWAEKHSEIKPGQTVVEASSGNTGIGLAMVCAAKGYPFVCVMSEAFSVERRKLMRFLGAQVIITPGHLKGTGMVMKAKELADTHGWFLTRQFENEANAWIHEVTTGPEIAEAFSDIRLDYFVCSYGTGGTLKGVGKVLREKSPATQIVVAEPDTAPLLVSKIPQKYNEDGTFAEPHEMWRPHLLQGWTTDFIPKLVDDAQKSGYIDQLVSVGGFDAIQSSKDLAQKEGIFTGISGGGCLAAGLEIAKGKSDDTNILIMLPDTGERYLSTHLFRDIPVDMTPEETEIAQSTPLYRFDVQQPPPASPPVPSTEASDKYVNDFIDTEPVAVFSLKYCEFCWSLIDMLKAAKIPHREIHLDDIKYVEDKFGNRLRTSVCSRTGSKTFPQVLIKGEFVGGATDMFDMWKNGELQSKLKSHGVAFDPEFKGNPYDFLPGWLHKRG